MEKILKKLNGVALIDDGKEVKIYAKGYADFEKNILHTENSNFKICSISKMFVAIAINQLAERQLLKKDDLINKYIGNCFVEESITIYNLLTHTSGIKNYIMYRKEIAWDKEHTSDFILSKISKKKLKFKVGSKWSYSNTGYYILALIIEKVSGLKYHEYIKKNIFDVANMKNSSLSQCKDMEFVPSQAKNRKSKFDLSDSLLFGAGDVISNVKDLHRFAKALIEGKLVSLETLREMSKPVFKENKLKYGEGLFINNSFDIENIGHSGSLPGYATQLSIYKDTGVISIVLTNNRVLINPLVYPDINGKYIEACIAEKIFNKNISFIKKSYL
ncbi:MAG: serine hydrolase domain-containing protein [Sarcina sp.]